MLLSATRLPCLLAKLNDVSLNFLQFQVLLGDVGAGKSSLVLRFVKGQFVEFQVSVYMTTVEEIILLEFSFYCDLTCVML